MSMILPKVRDPRFVTIRRGGTLTDVDHHLLALWAAVCAEHVLDLFESVRPGDPRPRGAIEHARAWVPGEVAMMQARAAGGHAMGAATDLRGPARFAAYAARSATSAHCRQAHGALGPSAAASRPATVIVTWSPASARRTSQLAFCRISRSPTSLKGPRSTSAT